MWCTAPHVVYGPASLPSTQGEKRMVAMKSIFQGRVSRRGWRVGLLAGLDMPSHPNCRVPDTTPRAGRKAHMYKLTQAHVPALSEHVCRGDLQIQRGAGANTHQAAKQLPVCTGACCACRPSHACRSPGAYQTHQSTTVCSGTWPCRANNCSPGALQVVVHAPAQTQAQAETEPTPTA